MNDSATLPSQTPEAEDEISLLDLLQVVADNLRLLILGPLAVGLAALGISFAVPPTFTAKTLFLPPQQQQSSASALIQSLGSMGGLAGAAIGGIKNPADQYIAFMKTASLQDALIERFKLQERYESKFKVDTRKQLLDNTKLASGKDGIITLEVDDRDPKFAADLANAYIDELRRLMTRLAITEAQMRRQFFEGKLKEAKESLTAADQALRSTGINSSTLKSSPAAAVEVVAKLRAGITAQEIKIANMRGFLTESAPDIKQAMNELSVLREQLARVDEAREGAVIQVVDPATPPEKKAKPKKALIAVIATLAAGFLLLLWVFVRQALRSAAQNPDSAAKIQGLRLATRRALGLR